MAFTNPSTWVAGAVLTAAQLNQQVRDNTRFLHGPPIVRVRRSTTQSINNSTWTAISFNTEDWDTDTMWSSTAPTKIICRTAGKYEFSFNGSFAASTAGTYRALGLRKNTTSGDPNEGEVTTVETANGVEWTAHLANTIALTTGQFVQAVQKHNVGSAHNAQTFAGSLRLAARWVSS